MRLPDFPAATVERACAGDLSAIDAILIGLQPGLYNLAMRMLGHREDARDATQDILLRIVTHLGTLRDPAALGGWAFQLARNHLLTARARRPEAPALSWDDYAERLQAGLRMAPETPAILTPEDKAAARELAVRCTQGMMMCLDRPQRLAWLLDIVFELDSDQAALVQEITPEAHRQRLSRARAALRRFTGNACGLVNPHAACRCEQQLPATSHLDAVTPPAFSLSALERADAERRFDRLVLLGDAAALFRTQPAYQAPGAMLDAIRLILTQSGYRA